MPIPPSRAKRGGGALRWSMNMMVPLFAALLGETKPPHAIARCPARINGWSIGSRYVIGPAGCGRQSRPVSGRGRESLEISAYCTHRITP
jgi:hypothetical protein